MTTSFKTYVCIAGVFLGTLLRPHSHAQVTTTAEPAEQATAEKPAEDGLLEGFTANLNTMFYSKYVWRGLELSKDSLVIFPSLTFGYKGFAVNSWFDVDTDFNNPPPGRSSKAKLQEIDWTLTYSNKIDPWKLNYTFGYILYLTKGFFGDTHTKNAELFTTLGLDVLLKPTLSVYSEIMTGTSWYSSFALSHGFKVYKDWSLDVGGWVSYLYNREENCSTFHDGNLWAGLKVPLSKQISITPKVQYSFPLSSDAKDRIKANSFNGRDSQFVYGGIVVDMNVP
jgi:hypothetical protein